MQRRQDASIDLIIVGGGIVGLWCAYFAQKAGLRAALYDSGKLASAASGGLLGALMPHTPDPWNGKKQFQLEGLVALARLVGILEDETGISCGYRRVGRISPLWRAEHLTEAKRRCMSAAAQWRVGGEGFEMRLLDSAWRKGWPAADATPFGATFDTLCARISPRQLTAALRAAISGKVEIFENTPVAEIGRDHVIVRNRQRAAARHIIVTAGLNSFRLLKPLALLPGGRAVKGQAALLNTALSPSLPVVHQQGTYLVVQEDGRTAIGSTSERTFDDPRSTDTQLEELVTRARALCPLVGDAEIVERWANVRMQPAGRDPLLGKIPRSKGLYLATGGFKISFGIAHHMAMAVLAKILQTEGPLVPDSFDIANRVPR